MTVDSVQAPAGNRWSEPARYIMGVVLLLAGLLVVYIGRSAIPLVLSAALLALLVDPIIRFLAVRLRMNKNLAIVITYLFVVAMLLVVPLLLIQPLVEAANFALQIDPNLIIQRLSQVVQSFSTELQAHQWLASVLNPALDSLLTALNYSASAAPTHCSRHANVGCRLEQPAGKGTGRRGRIFGTDFFRVWLRYCSRY